MHHFDLPGASLPLRAHLQRGPVHALPRQPSLQLGILLKQPPLRAFRTIHLLVELKLAQFQLLQGVRKGARGTARSRKGVGQAPTATAASGRQRLPALTRSSCCNVGCSGCPGSVVGSAMGGLQPHTLELRPTAQQGRLLLQDAAGGAADQAERSGLKSEWQTMRRRAARRALHASPWLAPGHNHLAVAIKVRLEGQTEAAVAAAPA